MKFFTKTALFVALSISTAGHLFAQAPSSVNYQAVIRNGSGNLLANTLVIVQFSFIEDTPAGTVRYKETHTPNTTAFGLVNVAMGTGTPVAGTFASINWSTHPYYLKVEVNTGSGFVDLGTTQIISVPYALESKHSAQSATSSDNRWNLSGSDISNNNTGKVGVGTTVPKNKLDVEGAVAIGSSYSGTSTAPANGLIVQGNAGLGTSSPVNKLDVEGAVAIGSSYSGTSTAPANGLVIQGKVGIGNANPDQDLQIGSYSTAQNTYMSIKTAGGNAFKCGIMFRNFDDNDGFTIESDETTNQLRFITAPSTTAMAIDRLNGNIGIGVGMATPAANLHVFHGTGAGGQGLMIERNGFSSRWSLYASTVNNDMWLNFYSTTVGTFNSSSGTYTPASDERRKTNIREIGGVMENVMKLNVKKYNFKKDQTNKDFIGLIAQDVNKLFPELINHVDGDGLESYFMDYSGFGVLAIKAIQEQQQQIDMLKKEIEDLKTK